MEASNTYYCKNCNIYFDSPQSLDVHLQYHKENLINMWTKPEENKKDTDLENGTSFVQTNRNATSNNVNLSEASVSMFGKQNENEIVPHLHSFSGHNPTSPMDYNIKVEPGITSPQDGLVSQGPSSGSEVNNYYQEYQHHPVHQVPYDIFSSIGGSFDEHYFNKANARFHPYARTPSSSPVTEVKEERLTPNTPEILDLDSQKVLNSNATQNNSKPLSSVWRQNEQYQLHHLSGSVNNNSGLEPPTNFSASSSGLRPDFTRLGPSSSEHIPLGLEHSSIGLGPSSTELRFISTALGASSLGLEQPVAALNQASIGAGVSAISNISQLHSGNDQSSYLVSSSSTLAPTIRQIYTGIGYHSGLNSNSPEMGTIQHMPPPLQQNMYGNPHSVNPNSHMSPNNSYFPANSSMSPYYSHGLPINTRMPNNSSGQFASPPIRSPSSREVPPTEYPSNVKKAKNFHCEACNKWFTSHGHLKRHYNTTLHKNMSKVNETKPNITQPAVPDTIQSPIISPSSKSIGETSTASSHDDDSNLSTTNDSLEPASNTFQPVESAFQPPIVNAPNYSSRNLSFPCPSSLIGHVPHPHYNQTHSFPSEQSLTAPTLYQEQFSSNLTYASQPPATGSGNMFVLGNNYVYPSQQGGLQGPEFHSRNEYSGPNTVDALNGFRRENNSIQHHYVTEKKTAPARVSPEPFVDQEASLDSIESSRASPADNYKCNDCPKTFNRMCYLTQHRSTYHEGVKPFKCSICGKKFTDEVTFKDHHGKHAGEKPYKCEICPKQFNHKTDLRRHMCLHTGEKPFSCEQCGKGFIRKDHMLKHFQTHKKKAQAAAAAANNSSHSHPSMTPNNSSGFISHNGLHPHGPLSHQSPRPLGHPRVVY